MQVDDIILYELQSESNKKILITNDIILKKTISFLKFTRIHSFILNTFPL